MTQRRHLAYSAAVFFLLSGCAAKLTPRAANPTPHATLSQYRLTLIPFPATGINDKGEMFGTIGSGKHNPASQRPDMETQHLAVWQNGRRHDLGALAGTDWCRPTAINDLGEITGEFGPYAMGPGDTEPEQTHGFLWTGRKVVDLGSTGEADDINNKCQVVGQKTWPDGQHGFLYFQGKTTEIKNPLSLEYSGIKAINNKGQMAGVASGPSQRTGPQPSATVHAFVWNNGIASEIHLPEQSGVSIYGGPVAINNTGQVLINADLGVTSRCYLWQNGSATNLGTLPGLSMSGIAINNRGQIIGNATKSNGSPQTDISHPFLWQSGQLYDLTHFPVLDGWKNTRISSLNNRGQIVGYGTFKGVPRVFLLTPAINQ